MEASRWSLVLAALLGIGAGCSTDTGPRSSASVAPFTVEIDETRSGSGGSSVPTSICKVVNSWGAGAGIYRVAKLVGAAEENPDFPETMVGVTYVHLELVTGWTPDAKPSLVARIPGGPVGDGEWLRSFVHLKTNEVAGMILWDNSEVNAGYVTIPSSGLFQPGPDGACYNGVLLGAHFFTLEEIGDLVKGAWGTEPADCPEPDPLHAEAPPTEGPDAESETPPSYEELPPLDVY